MFGKRKRRVEDEDEPLVPRGLVWHATAEPKTQQNSGPTLVQKAEPSRTPTQPTPLPATTQPNNQELSATEAKPEQKPQEVGQDTDPFGNGVQYAQLLEIAKRARLSARAESSPAPNQEAKAHTSPLPWWRMQRLAPEPPPVVPKPIPFPPLNQEPIVPSKSETPVSSIDTKVPSVAPGVPSFRVPVPVEVPPPIGFRTANGRSTALPLATETNQVTFAPDPKPDFAIAPKKRSVTTLLTQAVAQLRASLKALLSAASDASGRLRERSLAGVERANLRIKNWFVDDLRPRFASALGNGKKQARAGMVRSRAFASNSRSSFKNAFGRLLAYVKSLSRTKSAPAWVKVEQVPHVTETRVVAQVAPTRTNVLTWPRLRVRLAGLPLKSRILFARQFSTWEISRAAPYNSRLWTSMVMAGLAALIALGIVSVAPRYAAKSLPSHIVRANSASVLPSVPKANIVTTGQEKRTGKKPIAKSAPPKLTSGGAAHPKSHHDRSSDEDYVAPDTYKYYGNSSSQASR